MVNPQVATVATTKLRVLVVPTVAKADEVRLTGRIDFLFGGHQRPQLDVAADLSGQIADGPTTRIIGTEVCTTLVGKGALKRLRIEPHVNSV